MPSFKERLESCNVAIIEVQVTTMALILLLLLLRRKRGLGLQLLDLPRDILEHIAECLEETRDR
jgi:hypothetical protein